MLSMVEERSPVSLYGGSVCVPWFFQLFYFFSRRRSQLSDKFLYFVWCEILDTNDLALTVDCEQIQNIATFRITVIPASQHVNNKEHGLGKVC